MKKEYNSVFDTDWFNSSREYTFETMLSSRGAFSVDDAIQLLCNIDFYHYTGQVPPYRGGNINNNQTGISVVLDPEGSTVYFAYGIPYGGFSRWFRYNYKTDEFVVYRDEDRRLHDPDVVEYLRLEERWKNVKWGDKDELRQMVEDIERLSVENFWTMHSSCWAWYNLGDTARAKAIIGRQIEKYPDFLTSYSNMGFYYLYEKEYDKAIEYFERAIDMPITNESKQMYCYEQLAACYAKVGNEAKARDCNVKILDYYNRYWIPGESREEVDRIRKAIEE
jgi:tetratricopeptide (TPR) repeat protein